MRKFIKIAVVGVTALALTSSLSMAVTRDAAPAKSPTIEKSQTTPTAAAAQKTVQLEVTGMT